MLNRPLLLFGLILVLAALTLAQVPGVSFQIHSYDDLREWPQALLKGATWFKVDPNFQNSTFCETQQRVSNPADGCFVLTHDTPDPSNPSETRDNYNTTQDILDFISDSAYSSYFANQNYTNYIALCFKTDFDVCDNSTDAVNWNNGVQSFVKQAEQIIRQNKLNVQFILDGSATANHKRKCLKDSFKPWVFTYIITDDPITAFFSNDPLNGDDRFAVNNIPEDEVDAPLNLELERVDDYGKFKKSEYPFLFWEPSKQSEILSVVNAYNRGPLAPKGFRFAINIDPVQFQVYASQLAGVAGNFRLNATGANPLVTVFDSASSPSPPTPQVGVYAYQIKNTTFYTFFTTAALPANTTFLTAPAALALPSSMDGATLTGWAAASDSDDKNLVVASDASGNFAIFSYANLELTYVSDGNLGKDRLIRNSRLAVAVPESGDLTFVEAYSKDEGSCGVAIQAWQLNNRGSASRLGSEECISAKPGFGADIAIAAVGSLPGSVNPKCNGTLGGLVSFSDKKEVHSAYFCLVETGKNDYSYVVGGPTKLNVGAKPSISLRPFSGDVAVLQLQDEGYCYNNVVANKRPNPALCDSEPESLSHVLTYTFGPLSQLAARIDGNQSVSSCDNEILHGMYDMGSNPNGALFLNNAGSIPLGIVEVHDGLDRLLLEQMESEAAGAGAEKITAATCGYAEPHDGVVMDSIPVSLGAF